MEPYVKYFQNSFLVAIGYFDLTNLDNFRTGDWLVFVLANVVNFILLLNLLISIINETFARVFSTFVQTSYKEKVKIMKQLQDSVYGMCKKETMNNEMLFIAQVKKTFSTQ